MGTVLGLNVFVFTDGWVFHFCYYKNLTNIYTSVIINFISRVFFHCLWCRLYFLVTSFKNMQIVTFYRFKITLSPKKRLAVPLGNCLQHVLISPTPCDCLSLSNFELMPASGYFSVPKLN